MSTNKLTVILKFTKRKIPCPENSPPKKKLNVCLTACQNMLRLQKLRSQAKLPTKLEIFNVTRKMKDNLVRIQTATYETRIRIFKISPKPNTLPKTCCRTPSTLHTKIFIQQAKELENIRGRKQTWHQHEHLQFCECLFRQPLLS